MYYLFVFLKNDPPQILVPRPRSKRDDFSKSFNAYLFARLWFCRVVVYAFRNVQHSMKTKISLPYVNAICIDFARRCVEIGFLRYTGFPAPFLTVFVCNLVSVSTVTATQPFVSHDKRFDDNANGTNKP